MSLADFFLSMVREAAPDVIVYDGMPSLLLEDRPKKHVIVTVGSPVKRSHTISRSLESETLKAQVMVVVSDSFSGRMVEGGAAAARELSGKIADYVTGRPIVGNAYVERTVSSVRLEQMTHTSYMTFVEVSQYEVNV